jgi:hypothetical protein
LTKLGDSARVFACEKAHVARPDRLIFVPAKHGQNMYSLFG